MSNHTKRTKKYSHRLKRSSGTEIKPNSLYKTNKESLFADLDPLSVKYDGIPYGVIKDLYNDLQGIHGKLEKYLKACNGSITAFLIEKGYNTPNVKQSALIEDLKHLLVIQDEVDYDLLKFDEYGFIKGVYSLEGQVILKQPKPNDFDKGWYKYVDGAYVEDLERKDEMIGVVL